MREKEIEEGNERIERENEEREGNFKYVITGIKDF